MNANGNLAEKQSPEEFEQFEESLTSDKKESFFTINPINSDIEEASKQPDPKMLLNDFWHEGELVIFFSDTGVGKSVAGYQAGDMISSGRKTGNIFCEVERQKVLYFDFELSKKQVELRYKNKKTGKTYRFSDNFLRAYIDVEKLPDEYDPSMMIKQIELAVIDTEAKIVIIDNITYLINEIEKSKNALPMMRALHKLKNKHKLSILVIAHTPKRDQTKPLTENSLQGSKMIANFADNMFAIGVSAKDKNLSYMKRIKFRTGVTTDEVLLCEKVKGDDGFLHFEVTGRAYESDHLKEMKEATRNQKIIEMYQGQFSYSEIAKELNISKGTVHNIIKKHQMENEK